MSACKVQAVSQVGWRLIVASRAKISRPRPPRADEGPRERTCSMKVSISGLDETGAGVRCGSLLIGKFYTEIAAAARPSIRHIVQMAALAPGCKLGGST